MGAGMSTVELSGELVCATEAQAALVERLLPVHVELTRAEEGCISFEVARLADSLVWRVEERFSDADAFAHHQQRTAESVWGLGTVGIERRYTVAGL